MNKTRDGVTPTRLPHKVSDDDSPGQVALADVPPLRPRPKLMLLMAVLLAAFFVVLVVLYVTTVYPNRNKPQSVETDQPTTGIAK